MYPSTTASVLNGVPIESMRIRASKSATRAGCSNLRTQASQPLVRVVVTAEPKLVSQQ
jgi:hypothetical protein